MCFCMHFVRFRLSIKFRRRVSPMHIVCFYCCGCYFVSVVEFYWRYKYTLNGQQNTEPIIVSYLFVCLFRISSFCSQHTHIRSLPSNRIYWNPSQFNRFIFILRKTRSHLQRAAVTLARFVCPTNSIRFIIACRVWMNAPHTHTHTHQMDWCRPVVDPHVFVSWKFVCPNRKHAIASQMSHTPRIHPLSFASIIAMVLPFFVCLCLNF